MEHQERRASLRMEQHAQVLIKMDDDQYQAEAALHDISLDGIRVECSAGLIPKSACTWEITIEGPSSKLMISGKGRIVRQDNHGVAIKFSELQMDSYSYLRNLV